MEDSGGLNSPLPRRFSGIHRILIFLTLCAVLLACGFATLLGVRRLLSPDLGYHLAYGEHFLDTGQIVDSSRNVYTVAALRNAGRQLKPGPGCWYDSSGRYRFPNANWLSQVAMAAVHRLGGANGLCLLQAILAAGIAAAALATMLRMGTGPVLAAGGVLLIALTAYERFSLRPELFGYLLLAAELYVLVQWGAPRGINSSPRKASRGLWVREVLRVVSLVLLQLLLVNLHSYFLLGLAMTGAFLADGLLRMGWHQLRGERQLSAEPRRRSAFLAAVLAGQAAVCFVNPWTWRLAAMPIQTLWFIHHNNIAGGSVSPGGHPWSHIGEFFRPFGAESFWQMKATCGYIVLLSLAGLGGLAAAIKRRWACLFLIAGFTVISLSMRRNIAPAAVIIAPLALGALCLLLKKITLYLGERKTLAVSGAFSLLAVLASVYLGFTVITQRFYFNDRSPVRFGLGGSELNLPLRAAKWLNNHKPAGRLWTGYTGSSNLHYFTQPHRSVPILTNTWAYPPAVMQELLEVNAGGRPFDEAAEKYGLQIVCLRVDRSSTLLARRLVDSPAWALVHLDAMHAVFVRNAGANAELAEKHKLTAADFDTAGYKQNILRLDPVPAYAYHVGGVTLLRLGWNDAAADLFRAAVEADADYHEAWNNLGTCLASRGAQRISKMDIQAGRTDWREARNCFRRAVDIKPNYRPAKENLDLVQQQLAALARGVILLPRAPKVPKE
ncbi:MAG: hypothetical protein SVT52_00935 [Planctomycetota bacterium]|nr:hypothetical protein [Planctomycetota bacterium]